MIIIIPNRLNTNIKNAMRQCGYNELFDRRSGKISYSRPLSGGHYPRFHIYIEDTGDNLKFNLHIDQKRTSYEGHTAHSGEYDGKVVIQEGDRLKNVLTGMVIQTQTTHKEKEGEEKGFFEKIFGK